MRQQRCIHLLFVATAMALYSSCSKDDIVSLPDANSPAVAFEVRETEGLTRVQPTGEITSANITDAGIGVFAYNTGANDYSSSASPNFMYNQHVTKSGSNWTYSPIKYWPNPSEKLSFFAYAPYVATDENGSLTESATKGITLLTPANNAPGNPTVSYTASETADDGVDLLWGVQAGPDTPWKNMTKQGVDEKIAFTFKHALAGIQFSVKRQEDTEDVKVEEASLSSVTLSEFKPSGKFNLAEGTWSELSGSSYTIMPFSGSREFTETATNPITLPTTGGTYLVIPEGIKTYTLRVIYTLKVTVWSKTYDIERNETINLSTKIPEVKAGELYKLSLTLGWDDADVEVITERSTSAGQSLTRNQFPN